MCTHMHAVYVEYQQCFKPWHLFLLPTKPTTFYFQSMGFGLGWLQSKLLLVYLMVCFTTHLSPMLLRRSYLSFVGLFCPCASLSLVLLYLLLSMWSTCPSIIGVSRQRTATAAACQKVHECQFSLRIMQTDTQPATAVNSFICICAMWPWHIIVRPPSGPPQKNLYQPKLKSRSSIVQIFATQHEIWKETCGQKDIGSHLFAIIFGWTLGTYWTYHPLTTVALNRSWSFWVGLFWRGVKNARQGAMASMHWWARVCVGCQL